MAWLKIHNQSCILLIKQQKVLYTEKTKKQTKQNRKNKTIPNQQQQKTNNMKLIQHNPGLQKSQNLDCSRYTLEYI